MSAVLPTDAVPPVDGSGLAAAPRMSVPAVTTFKGEERLNLSRERMRLWLETSRGGKKSPRYADRARRSSWFAALRANPAVGIGFNALSAWWASHPLRAATALAGGMARSTLGPAARRRPFAAIGLALVAGVVAVRLRPWRWLLRRALFVGLATQVVNRVVAEVPLESLLKVFTSFTGGARAATRSDAARPAATPGEPAAARPGAATSYER